MRMTACCLMPVLLGGAAGAVRFEDYPATPLFRGTPAHPRFVTPGQRQFRTAIEDEAKQGPNFAGRFRLVEWGCGTGCISIAVVDLLSGIVSDGPFGRLPKATIYLGPPPDPDTTGLFFRSDSRLLIASGCPNWKDCGVYYYDWNGISFRLITFAASGPGGDLTPCDTLRHAWRCAFLRIMCIQGAALRATSCGEALVTA